MRVKLILKIRPTLCTFQDSKKVGIFQKREEMDGWKLNWDILIAWMEVKLRYFDSKKGTDGPVEARLFEMNHNYEGRLIVEEVEFRPK
ncbi:hypothetical protein KY284_036013 [Solanum tuberosum]|nr:hypothetical protein KY284_036013 [Solanum tuberosum]